MKRTTIEWAVRFVFIVVAVVAARPLYLLAAETACAPGPVLGPNDVPFQFDYDANDILLPLWPDDPTRWELPTGLWTRPAALACDPDGQSITVVCAWSDLPTTPIVMHDPNAATWSTTIRVPLGIYRAVFRATDPNGLFADYTLVFRGVKPPNRPPEVSHERETHSLTPRTD
jgi:hypothetical protein